MLPGVNVIFPAGTETFLVERDEFNHVARSLPATATDFSGATTLSGPCALRAEMPDYESSTVDFSDFTIGKDLRVPDITVKPK
jgi:hypothetical protein